MSFYSDEKAGRNAANTFWWFETQLSRNNVLSPKKVENAHITGKDIIETIIAEEGLIGVHTEVKAILDNKFIRRNNNPKSAPDIKGTLEFENWSNAWDEHQNPKPRSVWTDGWSPKILHPERYNTEGVVAVKPTRLVFMLCKDNEGNYPYACINFENFSKLEERLYEIVPFDLNDIPSPTLVDYWQDEKLNTPYNCWYVPFDKVKDLATITRILDVPLEPSPAWQCPLKIQEARCINLLNSCNNPPFSRKEEAAKARKASKAENKNKGLPADAPLQHFSFFTSSKLPSWVKYGKDDLPDWLPDLK